MGLENILALKLGVKIYLPWFSFLVYLYIDDFTCTYQLG